MAEKKMNPVTRRWEIDGVPVTYWVTWKHVDTGKDHVHVKEFDDVDQGYDYYQMMQRDGYCYKVTWEHVPW